MINLMYLIFIAIILMNVDREVLKAFHNTKETLELTARLVDDNNQFLCENLRHKIEKTLKNTKPSTNNIYKSKQHTDQIFKLF
ncbi:MAG: hypothetical protein ABI045_07430 [Flavobacteriales bacterium]